MVAIEVTPELIRKVATAARLNLTDAEVEKFVPQIKEIILDSFNRLDEVDAKENPSFQPLPLKNRVRKDVVKTSLSEEDVFVNAKKGMREGNYFVGPKVL